MKYMLLIYGNEAGMQAATKAQAEERLGAYVAYTEALELTLRGLLSRAGARA